MAQVRTRKLESQGPARPDVVATSLGGVPEWWRRSFRAPLVGQGKRPLRNSRSVHNGGRARHVPHLPCSRKLTAGLKDAPCHYQKPPHPSHGCALIDASTERHHCRYVLSSKRRNQTTRTAKRSPECQPATVAGHHPVIPTPGSHLSLGSAVGGRALRYAALTACVLIAMH